MPNIRVLIADDNDALLVSMSWLLKASGDIDVVGTAKNDLEAVTMTRELGPDVIIMDVRMPKMDGLEATSSAVVSLNQELGRSPTIQESVFTKVCLLAGWLIAVGLIVALGVLHWWLVSP